MTAITLPKDLEDWGRAEVAAGRAASIDHAAQKAIAGYRPDDGGVPADAG